MRHLLHFAFLVLTLTLSTHGHSQIFNRSGSEITPHEPSLLRRFPCGGETLFEENVQNQSFPASWTRYDLDGENPDSRLAFTDVPGWHVIEDPKDRFEGQNPNLVFVSVSWDENSNTASDDWLVSPKVTLTDNACLSWYAYSADEFFPESYSIHIVSDSTLDTLQSSTPIQEIEKEDFELTYRTLDLSEFAGQTVHIAFHHTSQDKFALVLDDIRVAKVERFDIGTTNLKVESQNDGDTTFTITASIRNFGLDTLDVDTLFLNYRIDSSEVDTMELPVILLDPNDTLEVIHDSTWRVFENGVYTICIWTNLTDDDPSNDTTCINFFLGVTSTEEKLLAEQLKVYPVPGRDYLYLQAGSFASQNLSARVINIHGQTLSTHKINGIETKIPVAELLSGMYYIGWYRDSRLIHVSKWLKY